MEIYLDPFADIQAASLAGCRKSNFVQIEGPGSAALVSGLSGTLGYGNAQPGLRLRGIEFLAPGCPFEGFVVDGPGRFVALNGNSSGTVCISGGGDQARTRIRRPGLSIVHAYKALLNAVRCTVTLINTGDQPQRWRYARFIDPDPTTSRSLDSDRVGWDTQNRAAGNQVTASHAFGTLRMRIDARGFATGSGCSPVWSQEFSNYRSGGSTHGDHTIGVSVDFGSVPAGESVTAVVTYF